MGSPEPRISLQGGGSRSHVRLHWLVGDGRKSKNVPEVLHKVNVRGLQLEFRAPPLGRTTGSIACFNQEGKKVVEVFTSFETLESLIEGIALLRERMRNESITQDISMPPSLKEPKKG